MAMSTKNHQSPQTISGERTMQLMQRVVRNLISAAVREELTTLLAERDSRDAHKVPVKRVKPEPTNTLVREGNVTVVYSPGATADTVGLFETEPYAVKRAREHWGIELTTHDLVKMRYMILHGAPAMSGGRGDCVKYMVSIHDTLMVSTFDHKTKKICTVYPPSAEDAELLGPIATALHDRLYGKAVAV